MIEHKFRATGFTTRSDIGPAREMDDISEDRHPAPISVQKAQAAAAKPKEVEEDLNDANYDEVSTYEGSVGLSGGGESLFRC